MNRPSFQKHRNAGLLLLLCLAVFASRTAWYDMRVVFESLVYSASMRRVFFVYALGLAPFILIASRGARYLLGSPLMMLYAFLNVYGVLLAVIYANSQTYIAQDVFKMTLVPVGFILVWYDPPKNASRLLERLANIVFAYQIIKLLMYLVWFRSSYGFVYGGVTDLFPLCFYGARACSSETRTGFRDVLMSAASLSMIAAGQKRTLVVCGAALAVYFLLTNFGHVFRRVWPYLAMAACVTILVLFGGLTEKIVKHDRFRRLMETNVAASIGIESKRSREVRIVYEELDRLGRAAYVFGTGHGAIFEEEIAQHTSGETVTHSVHFTPAALHYRYGLLGLALYGLTVMHLLFYRARPVSGWVSASSLRGLEAFGISTIVCSLTGFGLVDDVMVGSILGITVFSRKMARSSVLARRSALSRAPLARRDHPRLRPELPVPTES